MTSVFSPNTLGMTVLHRQLKERKRRMPTADPDPATSANDRPASELRRRHGNAARKIGIAIVSGHYKEGEQLPIEMASSGQFGISRSAYREATRILSAKGMLTSRPKAGTIVSPRTSWNLLDPDVLAWHFESKPSKSIIEDLFELRMIVEPAAAALAARRRTDQHVFDLESALATMRRETLGSELGRAADHRFHETILIATGNEVMRSLSSGIGAAIRWTTLYKQRERALPRDPIPDHKRVLEAIAAQDSDAARSAAVTLLLLAQEDTNLSLQL
jgi:DNA-binding FadR family transcriptional regulator